MASVVKCADQEAQAWPRKAAVDLLAVELVRIDSVNRGSCPGAAGEGRGRRPARAAAGAQRVRGCRCLPAAGPATAEPAEPDRPPHRKHAAAGRSLVLNGHLDTVGVAGMDEPFAEGRITGDRRSGRLLSAGVRVT